MKNINCRFNCAILHFGADKTGSTAIQTACHNSRDILYQNGVYYPEGRWHAILGSCFSEEPEKYSINIHAGNINTNWLRQRDAQYLEKLRAELYDKNGNFLIFSYEGFPDLDDKELQRFKSFVLEYAKECKIIYYVRAPESYALSAMSQRVRMGYHPWSQDNLPIARHIGFLQRACSVFGKNQIEVRLFDKNVLPSGNVIYDFFNLFNLPPDLSQQIANNISIENRSLTMEALLIGEKIIDYLSPLKLTVNTFNIAFNHVLEQIQGEKLRLTEEQARQIAIKSHPQTEYLKNEFSIHFPEASRDEAIAKKESLSHQTAASIAKLFIKFVSPESIIQNFKGTLRITEPLNILKSSSEISITVQIFNDTENEWKDSNLYPIALSYHWLDAKGQIVIFDGVRSPIPQEKIQAKQTVYSIMKIVTPDAPGDYKLILTMLQENVRWFDEAEFEPCILEVNVKPNSEHKLL